MAQQQQVVVNQHWVSVLLVASVSLRPGVLGLVSATPSHSLHHLPTRAGNYGVSVSLPRYRGRHHDAFAAPSLIFRRLLHLKSLVAALICDCTFVVETKA